MPDCDDKKLNGWSPEETTLVQRTHNEITKDTIVITEYENPTKFRYITMEDVETNGKFVCEIESQLESCCQDYSQNKHYVHSQYVIVRYYLVTTVKYLRGRVIHFRGDGVYLVESLDYGFRFLCRQLNLWVLPKKYSHKHMNAFWGGLYGVSPSERVEWSKIAVDLLHHQLEQAPNVIFTIKYYSTDIQHNYGNMLIKSSHEDQESFLDAAGYLLERHCARLDHQFMTTRNSENDLCDLRSVQLNEAGIKPNPFIASVIQLMELQRTKITQRVGLQSNDKTVKPCGTLKPPFEQLEKLDYILQMSSPREIPQSARKLSVVKCRNERSMNNAFLAASSSKSSSINSSSDSSTKMIKRKATENCTIGATKSQDVELALPAPNNPTDRSIFNRKIDPQPKTFAQPQLTEPKGTPTMKPKQSTFDIEKLDRIIKEMNCSSLVEKVPSARHQHLKKSTLLDKWKHSQKDQLLLAHSKEQVLPLRGSSRSLFHHYVGQAMGEMNIQSPRRLQSYAWPHLMKGYTMVAIDDTGSGRSWSYLPTLCSLVISTMQKTPTTSKDACKLGPLAVLVADSVTNANLLSKHCSLLMKSYETKMLKVVNTHDHSMLDVQRILLNSCGIFVTTVSHWNRLIRDTKFRFIDEHRLKHFIMDDYDRMLSAGPYVLKNVLHHLQSLAIPELQLVIIAQQWHRRLFLQLVERFDRNPLLLFADFLEAAIYGNIKLDVKLLQSSKKTQLLMDYLAVHVPRSRTIIYCKNDEELAGLQMELKAVGHDCIGIQDAQHQKIHELLLVSDADQHSALLPIKNFGLLIHYSMPASWSKFSMRFHAIIDNIGNILAPQDECLDTTSYMMLDESNTYELLRLAQFLTAHNIKLDEQMQQMVASCRQLTDQKRIFCHRMLNRGECVEKACNMRHFPVEGELQRGHSALWQPGNVVCCKLVKVYNPGHFVMMAKRYKLSDSDSWQAALPQPSMRKLSTALSLQMSLEQNQRMQQELSISEICVIQRGLGYQRVRIVDLSDKRLVTVQQLDEGRELLKVKRTELLQCDDDFKKIQPLAMEVRLCGLMPCDSDDGDWLPEATKWVSSQLSNLNDNQHLQIIVDFAMLDTIYVTDIVLLQDCPSMKTSVKAMQLYNELLEREFGQRDEHSIQGLHRMYEELFQAQQEQNLSCDVFDFKEILGDSADNDAVRQESDCSSDNELYKAKTVDSVPQQIECPRQDHDIVSSVIDGESKLQEVEFQGSAAKESSAPMEAFIDVLIKDLQSDNPKSKEGATNIMHQILASETPAKRFTTDQKRAPTRQEVIPKSVSNAIYYTATADNAVRPKVKWHQTLTQIEIVFEQQVSQYQLIHTGSVLVYHVHETTPPQRCFLNLLGEVQILSERQHGFQLQVKLAKLGLNTYWPTLLSSLSAQQHSQWLVYDTERSALPQSNTYLLNFKRCVQRSTQISNSYSDDNEDSNFSDNHELSFTNEELSWSEDEF
ncbi:putative ATP-dependent RNA helicase SoYb [Drosophila albomicans]|uniref:RNA helicase n=1 Tax=Drosophila albomicans TaxID=7291 RepID=A0A6P8XLQ4_DROAB|nr:putative ATP-dependent RNA helicase SoYb [Drosophila albomicans]XP_034099477.2 putative ATP-dependent RNA helicase SoYb [Drosophila albomicans]XP_051858382.1 putative ATP-dependent RNA helicase SoYb [Drosophila albomicans]